ncbi:protein spindle-F [Anopheles merus]|uniref:Zn-C2H2_12 domain-containing protein n=1 Tax=Anopheles merus TaxID=30066 RepID=A0A182VM47_ANOME|nr:protein spindle-F [Anopheles merus]
MSTAEPNAATSQQALQAALQTLKERCQTFQRRIALLEEENDSLRSLQTRATVAEQLQLDSSRPANHTELRQLRESVAELTHQKMQLAEQIAMVDTENRQLWRRLSLIVKDLGEVTVGPSTTLTVTVNQQQQQQQQQHQRTSTSQPSQNLIRSRTFTKHAPNPKLRERAHRDGSTDEEPLNLEDISLLNTCGFLESSGVDAGQDDDGELLRAALEANPDLSRCTDGLLDIKRELARQQMLMRDLYQQFAQELNSRTHTEAEKLMKDVMVEVVECELPPRKAKAPAQPARDEPSPSALMFGKVGMSLLLQEKVRAGGMKRTCPMCGALYGPETAFDDFQAHVEAHFLTEGETAMEELSLDRYNEYNASQPVGDF